MARNSQDVLPEVCSGDFSWFPKSFLSFRGCHLRGVRGLMPMKEGGEREINQRGRDSYCVLTTVRTGTHWQ
jgi:hypothetical protein